MKDVGFAQQTRLTMIEQFYFSIFYIFIDNLYFDAMTTGVGLARCGAHCFRRKPENPETRSSKKGRFWPFFDSPI